MKRAWPFEGKPEAGAKIRSPEDFLTKFGREGSEAVIVRIGLNDAQLVLVDGRGYWDRWVYHSVEEAQEAAEALGDLPVHVGEYPEATRVRIGKYQPDAEHFEHAAYPEQGEVGPVIPYPEKRPRLIEDASKERTEKTETAEA